MKEHTQNDNEEQPPCLTQAHDDDSASVSSTEEEKEEKERKEVVGAAAVTGAVTGMAIGGPAAAVVSGAGVAYLASSNDGCLGSATRATGEAVLGLKDKAAHWEENHHYVGNAAQSTKKRVEDWEDKHHYVQNTREIAKTKWEKLQEFGENNNVLEHVQKFTESTYQTITKGTSFALFKIRQCVHPDVTTATTITDSQKE